MASVSEWRMGSFAHAFDYSHDGRFVAFEQNQVQESPGFHFLANFLSQSDDFQIKLGFVPLSYIHWQTVKEKVNGITDLRYEVINQT